jgi:hypothetical protein
MRQRSKKMTQAHKTFLVGVPTLAPIGHLVGVKELDPEVEAAHLAIFLEVPNQFVLQSLRVAPLQRPRRIVRRLALLKLRLDLVFVRLQKIFESNNAASMS